MPLQEPIPRTSTASESIRYLDDGRVIFANSGSGLTYTIVNDDDGSWLPGAMFAVYQAGAGAVTIAAGSGVTLRTPASYPSAEQYLTQVVMRVGDNEWSLA